MAEATAAAEPLGPGELADALGPVFAAATGLVVAVSGGPDSMCLMHLLALCRETMNLPPVVVGSVDHGLRAGSASEAALVASEARALGLSAHVLTWTGPKPIRAIQERARAARYALLTDLCRRVGASHLLTAHTRDDQAETVLFRLARGSGIAGLAGMRPIHDRDGIVHVRPLLEVCKARLVAACASRGWRFLLDPSNHDPAYARTRMRQLLPDLAAEGLDAERFATLARRAARAEDALACWAERARGRTTLPAQDGEASFDGRGLAQEPAEIVLRVVALAVGRLGRDGPARLDRLESLAADLQGAIGRGARLQRTLNGAVVRLATSGIVTVSPEGSRHRGRSSKPVHRIPNQMRHDSHSRPGSLGNGGADAYIEHRRNATPEA